MSIFKKKEIYKDDEDFQSSKQKDKRKIIKRVINIVFLILVIILVMISIDVVSVARYNQGPFFAIKTKEYKDGGTKEYLGIGYKVIKYDQVQGRKDMEIGSWKLKYNIEPFEISALDLAIEFGNNYKKSYKKYGKKFIRTKAIIKKINKDKNTITLKYDDPDDKYDLEIICNMATKDMASQFSKYDEITFIGTIYNFKVKTNNTTNQLYINNVFAEK